MGIRKRTLKSIFIEYMIVIGTTSLLILAIVSLVMNILVQTQFILPANYEEQKVFKVRDTLGGKETISLADIPAGCRYALFDIEENLLGTNLKASEVERARLYVQTGDKPDGLTQYILVEGKQQWCVLLYRIGAHYSSPILEKYLPNVELLFILILVGSIVLGVSIVSGIYVKRIKRALIPLEEAVEQIKNQNLDFQVAPTSIKEFNEISESLEQLKEALGDALRVQWNLEKRKREQMAAIAHDIKTPLTIIKGNAELLVEDDTLDEEQKEYSGYILKNSKQIQDYVTLLLDISHSDEIGTLNRKRVSLKTFMEEVSQQGGQLAEVRQVQFEVADRTEEYKINIDKELLNRAVMNIISNGIDHTKEMTRVTMEVDAIGERAHRQLSIIIQDEGKGFSEQDLKNACKEFYMGEESRSRKGHYGMGLHIARQIIVLHGGSLKLMNREDRSGAKVIIIIPLV